MQWGYLQNSCQIWKHPKIPITDQTGTGGAEWWSITGVWTPFKWNPFHHYCAVPSPTCGFRGILQISCVAWWLVLFPLHSLLVMSGKPVFKLTFIQILATQSIWLKPHVASNPLLTDFIPFFFKSVQLTGVLGRIDVELYDTLNNLQVKDFSLACPFFVKMSGWFIFDITSLMMSCCHFTI